MISFFFFYLEEWWSLCAVVICQPANKTVQICTSVMTHRQCTGDNVCFLIISSLWEVLWKIEDEAFR